MKSIKKHGQNITLNLRQNIDFSAATFTNSQLANGIMWKSSIHSFIQIGQGIWIVWAGIQLCPYVKCEYFN